MPSSVANATSLLTVQNLGVMGWGEAFALQSELVAARKAGEISDRLLFVEHPHVVTMGRNGDGRYLLASPELLERSGIAYFETDRGGDVTYHGPGQIVGYPILDLRDWKRDVGAYVRAIEEVLIQTLAPGAAQRMVLGYAQLKGEHPRLIVCDISGYGDDGPYRDKKAYDLLIQSEAGFLSVTGTPEAPS